MPRRIWTTADDALLGTIPDGSIAEQLGVSRLSVWQRRTKLQIRPHYSHRKHVNWGATELGMLGRYPDDELASMTGRMLDEVKAKRLSLER